MNCFHFTYEYLIKQGLKVPNTWNGMDYKTEFKKIEDNPKKYLKKKQHLEFFSSFSKKVDKAQKNDIILHSRGVGVALNHFLFMTFNHSNKIKISKIKDECEIRRVM